MLNTKNGKSRYFVFENASSYNSMNTLGNKIQNKIQWMVEWMMDFLYFTIQKTKEISFVLSFSNNKV